VQWSIFWDEVGHGGECKKESSLCWPIWRGVQMCSGLPWLLWRGWMCRLFCFARADDVMQLYISSGCGYAYCYGRWISLSIGWGMGSLGSACWLCAFVSIRVGMSRFMNQCEGVLGFSKCKWKCHDPHMTWLRRVLANCFSISNNSWFYGLQICDALLSLYSGGTKVSEGVQTIWWPSLSKVVRGVRKWAPNTSYTLLCRWLEIAAWFDHSNWILLSMLPFIWARKTSSPEKKSCRKFHISNFRNVVIQ